MTRELRREEREFGQTLPEKTRGSTFPAIREMHKTARYVACTPVRTAALSGREKRYEVKDEGHSGPGEALKSRADADWCSLRGKQHGSSPKIKLEPPYDPAVPLIQRNKRDVLEKGKRKELSHYLETRAMIARPLCVTPMAGLGDSLRVRQRVNG